MQQNDHSIEQWKPIPNYEGRYEISNHGRIKSLARVHTIFKNGKKREMSERIMSHLIHNNGYKVIWLRKPNTHIKFFIHVLVARVFIPNPENKPVVNHIDCDKENCHILNLEWMSFSENTIYYYAKKKEKNAEKDEF